MNPGKELFRKHAKNNTEVPLKMVMHHLKYSHDNLGRTCGQAPPQPPPASVVVLFGGDGDQLLGCLRDVIGALDHLLRDQLDVGRRAGLRRQCLLALGMQAVGTGGQQAQGGPHQLRFGFLRKTGRVFKGCECMGVSRNRAYLEFKRKPKSMAKTHL